MNLIDTAIPDVKILEPKAFGDERGFFYESYNQKLFNQTLQQNGWVVLNDAHVRLTRSGILFYDSVAVELI